MPMLFIESPQGIGQDVKATLVREATAALDEAYHIPDVRIFFREYAVDDVAQDGRQHAEPFRPVCFLEVPPLRSIEAKRALVQQLNSALATAYRGLANTDEIMVFINEYPLEDVGSAGRLQADTPELANAIKVLNT